MLKSHIDMFVLYIGEENYWKRGIFFEIVCQLLITWKGSAMITVSSKV